MFSHFSKYFHLSPSPNMNSSLSFGIALVYVAKAHKEKTKQYYTKWCEGLPLLPHTQARVLRLIRLRVNIISRERSAFRCILATLCQRASSHDSLHTPPNHSFPRRPQNLLPLPREPTTHWELWTWSSDFPVMGTASWNPVII